MTNPTLITRGFNERRLAFCKDIFGYTPDQIKEDFFIDTSLIKVFSIPRRGLKGFKWCDVISLALFAENTTQWLGVMPCGGWDSVIEKLEESFLSIIPSDMPQLINSNHQYLEFSNGSKIVFCINNNQTCNNSEDLIDKYGTPDRIVIQRWSGAESDLPYSLLIQASSILKDHNGQLVLLSLRGEPTADQLPDLPPAHLAPPRIKCTCGVGDHEGFHDSRCPRFHLKIER